MVALHRYQREPRQGDLLIATPKMTDPNFDRTVVYILDHNEGGSLGIVINRSTELDVLEIFPDVADRVAYPRVVFQGGPVQPEVVIAIGSIRKDLIADDLSSLDDILLQPATRQISLDDTDNLDLVASLRMFSGYAGWGPGQLTGEIKAGAWLVVTGLDDDVFSPTPQDVWSTVLRRQDSDLAILAGYPRDVNLN